jgi:hypothetical protein
MTNYEILQHLKHVKITVDALIERLQLDDSTQQEPSNKQSVQVQKNNPSRDMGVKEGWTEMTGNQIEIPNIIM